MFHPSLHELIVGFVTVCSLIFSALLLLLYLSNRRVVFKQSGMIFPVLGLCSIGILCFIYTPSLNSKDVPALQKTGDGLINQIENYRLLNGRFPLSFEEANIHPLHTRYGSWRYHFNPGKGAYEVSVGSYQASNFVLYWHSEYKSWQLDT